MNNDIGYHSLFGCHIADQNMAPGFCINELCGEEWVYSPGQVTTHVCSWVLAVVREPGSSVHCRLWAAVFICGKLSLFFGQLWWWGGHGLALALDVMSWLLLAALLGCGSGWLKKGSDVTSCDISVMFKLTHEITCTISHDFLAVYSKNPSVLIQSLAEVKFSPQGWSQSYWAWVRPTCQLLPLKTTQAWQSSGRAWQELQGDNKDLRAGWIFRLACPFLSWDILFLLQNRLRHSISLLYPSQQVPQDILCAQVLVTFPQQHWAPRPYKQAIVNGTCWWADG